MDCIAYKRGYKYQLKENYAVRVAIKPDRPIDTDYLALDAEGTLTVKKGYAWDGASGGAIDTLTILRGSLVHDALYQLMRERHLDRDAYRDDADRLLRRLCREDGMSALRAWWVYQGVRIAGDPSADPANDRPVKRAPRKCRGA
jgi:Protein of unknown function (DUF1353)